MGAELKQTTATRLVLAYVFLFPLDALFLSRNLASGTSNSALYAVLLAAVHFLLFVTVLRLYSAVTDRDAMFLAMLSFAAILASRIFTVDPNFFFPVCRLPALRGRHVLKPGNPPRSAWSGLSTGSRDAFSGTAIPRGDVARGGERHWLGAIFFGSMLFFFLPAVQRRLFRAHRLPAFVDDGVHGQRGTRAHRRN